MLKTRSALASLVAASAIVVPTVSQAEDTLSVRVPYSDLNLASFDGQGKLQQRISYAAKYVCEGDLTNIDAVSAVFACRADAVASARPAYQAAVAEAPRHGTVTVLESAALIVAKP
jgi:UrcA family protein